MKKKIYLIMIAILSFSTLISCKNDTTEENNQIQPSEFTLDNSMSILSSYVTKDINYVANDLKEKGFILMVNDGENIEAVKNNLFKVTGKAFQTGVMKSLSLGIIDNSYIINNWGTKKQLFDKYFFLINKTKQMGMSFFNGEIIIHVKAGEYAPDHDEFNSFINEQEFVDFYNNSEDVKYMQQKLRNSEKEISLSTAYRIENMPFDTIFSLSISANLIGSDK